MPIRGYIELTPGMTVVPLFEQVNMETGAVLSTIRGETITVPEEGLSIEFTMVESGQYLHGFQLNDIYGGSLTTAFDELVF